MLAMRLFFWGTWPTPTPPIGQSPAATRYRLAYRVNTVIRVLLIAAVLWQS